MSGYWKCIKFLNGSRLTQNRNDKTGNIISSVHYDENTIANIIYSINNDKNTIAKDQGLGLTNQFPPFR